MNARSFNIRWIVFCFVSVFLLFSCGKTSYDRQDLLDVLTSDKDSISWELLSTDEIIPYPFGLCVTDSALAVLGRYQNHWVHTYDKSNGKFIASYINKGQGPGEIVAGENMNILNDSMLCVYDLETRSIVFDNMYNPSSARTINLAEIGRVIWNAWVISDEEALIKYPSFLPGHKITRGFAIVDLATIKKISDYQELPGALSDGYIQLTSQSDLTFSPDKKHFASTTVTGGTLEIFEIANNDLTPVCSEVIRTMKYAEKDNGTAIDEPYFYVFFASCSSNDRIYISYAASEDGNSATKISVWDWKGNLLKCYETGMLIYKLAYDTSSDTIYGIVEGEEGMALARLNLTTDHN